MKDQLELVLPTQAYKNQILSYVKEHAEHQEFELHGTSQIHLAASYEEWLDKVLKDMSPETVNPQWVPATTFLAIRKNDQKLVGVINIRHMLNDFLANYGGHIGYGIRPSERQKGYAKEMLHHALKYCLMLDLKQVMLSCNKDNIASAKTIKQAGGVLSREYLHDDGKIISIYWITLVNSD